MQYTCHSCMFFRTAAQARPIVFCSLLVIHARSTHVDCTCMYMYMYIHVHVYVCDYLIMTLQLSLAFSLPPPPPPLPPLPPPLPPPPLPPGPLLALIQQKARFTEREASLVTREVASALAFLHSRGKH